MGREVGGGFMFGNACKPVVDSCQCMAKSIQYCKVKIKIKKKRGAHSYHLEKMQGSGHCKGSHAWREAGCVPVRTDQI